MKQNMILPLLATALIVATIPATRAADTPATVTIIASPLNSIYGAVAQPSDYWRTILIRPETHYVNVRQDETVNFVLGDKAFAWTFDAPTQIRSFDMRQIAPNGALDRPIAIYVEMNPFRGG